MTNVLDRDLPKIDLNLPERNPRILEIQLKLQELDKKEDNSKEIKKLEKELNELIDKEPINEEVELYKKVLDVFEDTDYWKDSNNK